MADLRYRLRAIENHVSALMAPDMGLDAPELVKRVRLAPADGAGWCWLDTADLPAWKDRTAVDQFNGARLRTCPDGLDIASLDALPDDERIQILAERDQWLAVQEANRVSLPPPPEPEPEDEPPEPPKPKRAARRLPANAWRWRVPGRDASEPEVEALNAWNLSQLAIRPANLDQASVWHLPDAERAAIESTLRRAGVAIEDDQ